MRCFRGLHGKRFCFDFDLMRDFLGITHDVLPKVFSAHDRGKRCCIVLEILFVMA
ncbi:hypothetical protein F2Q69_00029995 [Brassica cretica]|uniref:Uncharacterized protein n=1 Tax=Brassica cretica TaxID=69181 RepID=A0A8S9S830_BRACR|nr:hypothetical protein F2Q69_00029995 [Brassica cretica]